MQFVRKAAMFCLYLVPTWLVLSMVWFKFISPDRNAKQMPILDVSCITLVAILVSFLLAWGRVRHYEVKSQLLKTGNKVDQSLRIKQTLFFYWLLLFSNWVILPFNLSYFWVHVGVSFALNAIFGVTLCCKLCSQVVCRLFPLGKPKAAIFQFQRSGFSIFLFPFGIWISPDNENCEKCGSKVKSLIGKPVA